MVIKTVRKVVGINEDKCNGCGVCVPSCAEGALKIVGGKARLVSDKYCDGLGACLEECPQGAITIEERPAEEFNEVEAKYYHQEHAKQEIEQPICGCTSAVVKELWHDLADEKLACGCSSATVQEIAHGKGEIGHHTHQTSQLCHWPVQLALVPATAPFLKGADLVLAADCTAFAYSDFHQDFLKYHALIIACPKLDSFDAHLNILTQLITHSELKSLDVVHMEVPCCSGLVSMAKQAIAASGKNIPLNEITIMIDGNLKI